MKILNLEPTSLKLKNFPVSFSDKFYSDIITGNPRPYIPTSLRKNVFQHLHYLSNSSKRSTLRLICDRFIWPNVASDIK